MRRQIVEGKGTNKKTSLKTFTLVSVTDSGGIDQGVTKDVVKSHQIPDALESRSQECNFAASPTTSLASQVSL